MTKDELHQRTLDSIAQWYALERGKRVICRDFDGFMVVQDGRTVVFQGAR